MWGLTKQQLYAMRMDEYPAEHWSTLRPPVVRFRGLLIREVKAKRGGLGVAEHVLVEAATLHYKASLLCQCDAFSRWGELAIDTRDKLLKLASAEIDRCANCCRRLGLAFEGDQQVLASIYFPDGETYQPPPAVVEAVLTRGAAQEAQRASEPLDAGLEAEDTPEPETRQEGTEATTEGDTDTPVSAEDDGGETEAVEHVP